jgi:predicted dehydrogenase
VRTYSDYHVMLREMELDAVIIATPTSMHAPMIRAALERGLHVFCEKPFCLDAAEGEELSRLATEKAVVNQVGYHNRFVGAFQEAKRLLDAGAIGEVTHALAEAYGPVVLKAQGSTWRSRRGEGGGCLFDYAAHPLNLINWYLGQPASVGGSVMNRVFSTDTEDEVYGTLYYADGRSAQISANWSDESYRRMTTSVTIWGRDGRIRVDRQECQTYLRDSARVPPGYQAGWNVRYTTDLTEPVWFYLRGEEYSAQLDYFVGRIAERRAASNVNSFAESVLTDHVMEMLIADSRRPRGADSAPNAPALPERKRSFFGNR